MYVNIPQYENIYNISILIDGFYGMFKIKKKSISTIKPKKWPLNIHNMHLEICFFFSVKIGFEQLKAEFTVKDSFDHKLCSNNGFELCWRTLNYKNKKAEILL